MASQVAELNARAAKLTKEIERRTKTKITRNAQTEIRNRDKLKKQPEKTYKRRSRRLGLPHVDLRLPWTEITPLKTYTSQPERTPRCVVQNVNSSTTTEELQKEFAQYGPVRRAEFIYSGSQGLIHYATVTFESMVNATTAAKCIDGTSLHGRILRVKVTDNAPKRQDEQVEAGTTPEVIQIKIDKWTDGFGRKTDNMEELADLLEGAPTISNKRIKWSQPQSPKTPGTSNESTPRKKRSRSRSGSSSSSTSISNENGAKTLESPPGRSRSRSGSSSSSPSISDESEAKALESPPGWTVTITQAKKEDTERTLTISGSPTIREKDQKHQQRRKGGKAAAMKTKPEDLDQTRAEKEIRTRARAGSAEEEKQKTKAADASKRTENKTTTTANAKAEKATTSKVVIDRHGRNSHAPMPSGNEAEPLSVLEKAAKESNGVQEVAVTNNQLRSILQKHRKNSTSIVRGYTIPKRKLPKNSDDIAVVYWKNSIMTKTDKASIPNPTKARSTKQKSNKPSTKRKLPAPEQTEDQGSDTDTIEIKTNNEDSTFAQVEKNKLQNDKDKPRYQNMEHHSREMTTKFAQNKTQRWKLNINDRLESKDGLWRSIETWILIAKGQEVYIRNNSKGTVLEAHKNGKVTQEFEIEGNANQLWKKGVPDEQGYYTLRNLGRKKVLTATSKNRLEIRDLMENAIRWRMAPTPQQTQAVRADLWVLHQTTQREDIRRIKDSAIYKNYRKAYRKNEVQRIQTPTLNCYTVHDWQMKTETFLSQLQGAMKEHNKRKKRITDRTDQTKSHNKQGWPIQQRSLTRDANKDYRQQEQANPDAHSKNASSSFAYKEFKPDQ